jgi:DNA polymerase
VNTAVKDRERVFEEMGLGPVWRLRHQSHEAHAAQEAGAPPHEEAVPVVPTAAERVTLPAVSKDEAFFSGWSDFAEAVGGCTRCHLGQARTNAVPGVGDIHAEWLFIGEGPGVEEDRQGEPFVGRSGKLLDNMLLSLNARRGENVYIANIVKCRACDDRKKDRPPTEEEIAACLPYLMWQIRQIQPKMMVALGRTAATALLGASGGPNMSSMRGKVYDFASGDRKIPLVVTYHPAYLLRTPMAKKQAWRDLCLALDTLHAKAQ